MTINSVSSATLAGNLQNTVSRLQSQMTTLQTENSTGRLADIGLTLGSDSGQVIALHQQLADLTALTTSNSMVTTQLSTASNALTNLQTISSSMLGQVVQATSTTPTSSGAAALQQTALGALSSLASMGNAEVGGVYVFGGQNTSQPPVANYSQTPASAAQTAVQNAFQSTFGFSETSASVNSITPAQMTSFLNGPFAALFSGSNWTSNWSSASSTALTNRISTSQTITTSITANDPAFQNMAQGLTMLGEFGGLNLNAGTYSALVTAAQTTINTANTKIIEANAVVGTIQNTVKQANSSISLQQNVLTTQINAKEVVNSYDVATQVTALINQLQVAYSLTAQIHKLSLVNFI
jgi:flagellar hook-associated protein 3 FlgL